MKVSQSSNFLDKSEKNEIEKNFKTGLKYRGRKFYFLNVYSPIICIFQRFYRSPLCKWFAAFHKRYALKFQTTSAVCSSLKEVCSKISYQVPIFSGMQLIFSGMQPIFQWYAANSQWYAVDLIWPFFNEYLFRHIYFGTQNFELISKPILLFLFSDVKWGWFANTMQYTTCIPL